MSLLQNFLLQVLEYAVPQRVFGDLFLRVLFVLPYIGIWESIALDLKIGYVIGCFDFLGNKKPPAFYCLTAIALGFQSGFGFGRFPHPGLQCQTLMVLRPGCGGFTRTKQMEIPTRGSLLI
jgi:hypothetical protein